MKNKVKVKRMEGEFQLEGCVRDHHIYKSTWTLLLGQVLSHGFVATIDFSIILLSQDPFELGWTTPTLSSSGV